MSFCAEQVVARFTARSPPPDGVPVPVPGRARAGRPMMTTGLRLKRQTGCRWPAVRRIKELHADRRVRVTNERANQASYPQNTPARGPLRLARLSRHIEAIPSVSG